MDVRGRTALWPGCHSRTRRPRGLDADFFYSEPRRAEENPVVEVKTSIEEFSAQIEERRTLLEKLDVRRGRVGATRAQCAEE